LKVDIKDAIKTIGNIMKAGAQGKGVKASKELIILRKEVCNNCPHLQEDRCDLCGCFIKIKALLLAARCPGGFWEEAMMNEMITGSRSPGEYIKKSCCG